MLPFCLWFSQGPKVLTTCFPALVRYASHPAGNSPHLANSPISKTRGTLPNPQPNSLHFPTGLQHYSNKHNIRLQEPGGHTIICYHKACSYRPCLFVHSIPQCNCLTTPYGMLSSFGLWIYVTKRLSVASVWCQVWCFQPSYTIQVEDPSLTDRMNRRWPELAPTVEIKVSSRQNISSCCRSNA